jgi:hypothetical protein
MKQVLRAADGRRAYGLAEAAFRDSVKGVVAAHRITIRDSAGPAPPHCLAVGIDPRPRQEQRRTARPQHLVSKQVRRICHKVFYKKRGATAGLTVADDSSDPGLLCIDPVPVDADHIDICKPTDAGDLVYAVTRDFIVDEVVLGAAPGAAWGALRRPVLPAPPRSRSRDVFQHRCRMAQSRRSCTTY